MAERKVTPPSGTGNDSHYTPQPDDTPIVNYTSKDGRHIDLDALRLNLEVIADDMDMAEWMARDAGDTELANALDALFHDVDGMIPAAPAHKGVDHE